MGKCDPYVVMAIEEDSHKTQTAMAVYDHAFQDSEQPFHKWDRKSRNSTVEVGRLSCAMIVDCLLFCSLRAVLFSVFHCG